MKTIKFLTILGLLLCMGCDIDEPVIIQGCTDSSAKNYNSEATDDDSSCVYWMNNVSLNEVYYTDKWIEIYNGTLDPINIGGMMLQFNNVNWVIDASNSSFTTIPSDSFLILIADEEFEDMGLPHLEEDLQIRNTGGSISLFDFDTTLIDSVTYPMMGDSVSYGRYPDGDGGWTLMTPTNNKSNSSGNAEVELYINEIVSHNNIGEFPPDYPDWVEIYNAGSESIDMAGMFVSDDIASENPYQIPVTDDVSTVVPAGGFLILIADKAGVNLNVDFKLSDNESVALWDTDGSTLIDAIDDIGVIPDDYSLGRSPDGSDNWVEYSTPSMGSANP